MFDPTGRNKKALTKKELLDIAYDQKLTEKHAGLESFTKYQLLELLGDTANQSKGTYPIKLTGVKLYPQAMCFFQEGLFVFDGASGGIWKVTLSIHAAKVSGQAVLLFNLPQQAAATGLACTANCLYVASPTTGLYVYSHCTSQLKCVVPSTEDISASSIACNDTITVFSDTQRGVIYELKDGKPVCISGLQQSGQDILSSDGFSRSCQHAQPASICVEGNTIFVCDEASLSIRLITDLRPLLRYHQTIAKIYEAFTVHSGSHGFRNPLPTPSAMQHLSDICGVFRDMLDGVRSTFSDSELKPNGPHGSLPYITMDMFNDLQLSAKKLTSLVSFYNPDYKISMSSLLSVPCEHHFSTMRARYQMPTLLQYCDLLSTVVEEQTKRCTTSAFLYYTHKTSYYPKPELQSISRICTAKRARKHKTKKLSSEDRRLMLNWRKDFCAGKSIYMFKSFRDYFCYCYY